MLLLKYKKLSLILNLIKLFLLKLQVIIIIQRLSEENDRLMQSAQEAVKPLSEILSGQTNEFNTVKHKSNVKRNKKNCKQDKKNSMKKYKEK